MMLGSGRGGRGKEGKRDRRSGWRDEGFDANNRVLDGSCASALAPAHPSNREFFSFFLSVPGPTLFLAFPLAPQLFAKIET